MVEKSVRHGKIETTVKKVLNVDYDAQVETLRQQSIKIKAETEEMIARMRTEFEQKQAEEANGG